VDYATESVAEVASCECRPNDGNPGQGTIRMSVAFGGLVSNREDRGENGSEFGRSVGSKWTI
jgi:hypothetical protein